MPVSETSPAKLNLQTQALIVLACGMAYFGAFQLNQYWFDWFEFSHGTNWIFIPSGLRLLLVLVLVRMGVIGIVLSSMAINYSFGDPNAHVFNIVTGVISGAAPYLARYLSTTWLKLDTQLTNLTSRAFFKVSILFAVANALMHQVWFYWIGHTENFVGSLTAMTVGDWLGSVLVLATASLCIKLCKIKPE